jgi:hypothetical protein
MASLSDLLVHVKLVAENPGQKALLEQAAKKHWKVHLSIIMNRQVFTTG